MSGLIVPMTGNPLAPEWMWGECSPSTPAGYEDLEFTYVPVVAGATYIVLAANQLLPDQVLQLDSDSEFWLRWFGVVGKQNSGIADVYVRYRDGKGRTLMPDFVLAKDIQGPVFPPMVYQPGDVLLFDIWNNGAGAPLPQLQFKGFKRRKR